MAEVSIKLSIQGRKETARALQDTGRDLDKVDSGLGRIGRSGLTAARGLGSVASSTIGTGVRTVAVGVGALAAGLATLAVAGASVGIKTAADMEQANISFSTMLGSGEKAQSFLSDLNKFAAATPFDFPGLTTAASSLISAGIDANKVIPIMTSLGNATSGMGTGAEGVQRATVALQQMSAAGKISGEDLNQLRDAGIPVFDLLTAATGKTTAQIADMAQKGKLGRKELDQLMAALESGKGLERFNGLMEKQSQSLSGMASTLKDTVGMGLSQAFQPAIPFLKQLLTDSNTFVTSSLPGITKGVGLVTAAIAGAYNILVHGDYDGTWMHQLGLEEDSKVVDYLFTLRDALGTAWVKLSAFTKGTDWGAVWDRVAGAVIGVKNALVGVNFDSLSAGLRAFGAEAGKSSVWTDALQIGATLLGTVLGFLSDHMNTIIKYMPLLVAGYVAWRVAQQAAIVVQIAGLPLKVAEIASTFALASANKALALQLAIMNGYQKASLITRIADFAMKVKDLAIITLLAIRVALWYTAIGIATAVTKVAAAGQWLLNAALTANPIGLVIAAIALLVGGLVWFFTKTEVGRQAWEKLSGAFHVAIDWITGTAVPAIKGGLSDAIMWLGTQVFAVRDKIGGFVDKLKDAWNWVKKLGDQIKDSAIGQAIGTISGGISSVFGGGKAAGGPVSSSKTYLVGERGPELFSPSSNGSITTNHDLQSVAAATVEAPRLSLAKEDLGLTAQDVESMSRPIVVQLNGREIARATYKDANQQIARR